MKRRNFLFSGLGLSSIPFLSKIVKTKESSKIEFKILEESFPFKTIWLKKDDPDPVLSCNNQSIVFIPKYGHLQLFNNVKKIQIPLIPKKTTDQFQAGKFKFEIVEDPLEDCIKCLYWSGIHRRFIIYDEKQKESGVPNQIFQKINKIDQTKDFLCNFYDGDFYYDRIHTNGINIHQSHLYESYYINLGGLLYNSKPNDIERPNLIIGINQHKGKFLLFRQEETDKYAIAVIGKEAVNVGVY